MNLKESIFVHEFNVNNYRKIYPAYSLKSCISWLTRRNKNGNENLLLNNIA